MYEVNEPNGRGACASLPHTARLVVVTSESARGVRDAQRRRRSYQAADSAFASAAFAGLLGFIMAAVLLTHGSVSGQAWAQSTGAALLAAVVIGQVVVRRQVLRALMQQHLDEGLSEQQAREQARSTLDAWVR